MDKHTVSSRIDADEVRRWQVEQIQKSLRQADDRKLLSHARVKQVARKWR
ncbi:MAG TPA: hypothetical protein VKR57_08700 [Terriglobales bacterium]|nr:hypothetical protein [Terriglobales bacterium]